MERNSSQITSTYNKNAATVFLACYTGKSLGIIGCDFHATSSMTKDVFHYAVKKGLEKEGWLITDDPLRISVGGADMEIDLGAEKIIAAERGEQKIAVEIKSFIGTSNISDFHTAVGQFINYQVALE